MLNYRSILKFLRKNDGIAAVEFALISPFFIMLIIGMVDFAFFINSQMKLKSTAVAAANYVAIKGDEDGLRENVLEQGGLGISSSDTNEHTWSGQYVFECANNVATTEDDDCGDDDYKRSFYEFTIYKDHDPIFPYKGFDEAIRLMGSVRLQVDK